MLTKGIVEKARFLVKKKYNMYESNYGFEEEEILKILEKEKVRTKNINVIFLFVDVTIAVTILVVQGYL